MVPKKNKKAKVVSSFVVYQIKTLICNRAGKIIYGQAFDTVFKDLTGYKHLSRDIGRCRTDTGVLQILAEVGFDDVFNMLNNEAIYACLGDLTILRARMTELNEYFDKCNKKRRQKAKKFVKEYEQSKKLYAKGIKNLRKVLGISDKDTPFDKRYGNIKGLIEYRKNGYDSGDSFSLYDDDPYDIYGSVSSFDDEDVEDREFGGGQFEDFVDRLSGGRRRSSKKRNALSYSPNRFEDDDEDDALSFYDEDESDDEEFRDEYEESLDALGNQVSKLTSVVQNLVNAQTSINQADAVAAERYNRRMRQSYSDHSVGPDIQSIQTSIDQLTQLMKGVVKKQNAMEEVLSNALDDDDDDVEYSPMVQASSGDPRIDMMRVMNPDYNKPAPRPEDMPSPYTVEVPSDSMIDEYNRRSTQLGINLDNVVQVDGPEDDDGDPPTE